MSPKAMQQPVYVNIRLATRHDILGIVRVLRESFVEYKGQYTSRGYLLTVLSVQSLARRWDEGPVWVASMDDQIVGTVAAVRTAETLHIRSMAVYPYARGNGIAGRLLRAAEMYAGDHGISRMDLCTTPFLHNAIRLYERHGFRRIDGSDGDLGGTPVFSMDKHLPEREP